MVDIAEISMGFYFSRIREIPLNNDFRANSAVNLMTISKFSFIIASE